MDTNNTQNDNGLMADLDQAIANVKAAGQNATAIDAMISDATAQAQVLTEEINVADQQLMQEEEKLISEIDGVLLDLAAE